MHLAVESGRVAVCQLILKNVDQKHPKNDYGETPLDLADGHKNILRTFSQLSLR